VAKQHAEERPPKASTLSAQRSVVVSAATEALGSTIQTLQDEKGELQGKLEAVEEQLKQMTRERDMTRVRYTNDHLKWKDAFNLKQQSLATAYTTMEQFGDSNLKAWAKKAKDGDGVVKAPFDFTRRPFNAGSASASGKFASKHSGIGEDETFVFAMAVGQSRAGSSGAGAGSSRELRQLES